ncbi:MAG: hypothetical protein NVV73_10260 [Cellvibrionaceae bacterium]|nr:hypothetical protein [Cellvibrionaceae bacterium]
MHTDWTRSGDALDILQLDGADWRVNRVAGCAIAVQPILLSQILPLSCLIATAGDQRRAQQRQSK